MVTLDEQEHFSFSDRELGTTELQAFFMSLGSEFPEGYTTEYNTGITQFARDAGNSLASGLFITIDYGHLQNDYYHPDRSTGTLQTFHTHTKAENPLLSPGEIDITAMSISPACKPLASRLGFTAPGLALRRAILPNMPVNGYLRWKASPNPLISS